MILNEAKMIAPLRPDNHVSRAAVLQSGFSGGHPLVFVHAPAGFGKSTTIQEYLSTLSCPRSWLSLDHRDDDLATFWSYLVHCFLRLDIGLPLSLAALLRTESIKTVYPVITTLINELCAVARETSAQDTSDSGADPLAVVVLDDLHKIENSEIYETLAHFIDYLPAGFQLVIASRHPPPFESKKWIVTGKMREVDFASLSFIEDETGEYLRRATSTEPDALQIRQIQQLTSGWPAALQLLSLSIGTGDNELDTLSGELRKGNIGIYELLFEEVLSRQSPDIQKLLCLSSALPCLSERICNEVLPGAEPVDFFTAIIRKGLFLISIDEANRLFRFHDLFKTLLQNQCRLQYERELRDTIATAATWFENNGQEVEAIELAFQLEEWDRIATLLKKAAPGALNHGQRETVYKWLTRYPRERIDADCELTLLFARALPPEIKFKQAPAMLMEVRERFRKQSRGGSSPRDIESRRLYIDTLLEMAYYSRLQGHFEQSLEWALEAANIDNPDTSEQYKLLYHLGMAFLAVGDIPQARYNLQHALTLCLAAQELKWAVVAMTFLIAALVISGDLKTAEQIVKQVEQQAIQMDLADSAAYRWLKLAPVFWLRETGQANLAEGYLQDKLSDYDLNQSAIPEPIVDINLLRAGYWLNTALRQFGAAGEYATRLSRLQAAFQIKANNCHPSPEGTAAQLALFQGDLTRAGQWVASHKTRLLGSDRYSDEPDQLVLAKALLKLDQFEDCGRLLIDIRTRAQPFERTQSVLQTWIYEAILHERTNNSRMADQAFAEALQQGESLGYFQTFLDEQEDIELLLMRMEKKGVCKAYCQQLLDALQEKTSTTIEESEIIDPLSERENEILHFIEAGYKNKEIAQSLELSVGTVKWHIINIYQKLAVNSRTEAVAQARYLKLL